MFFKILGFCWRTLCYQILFVEGARVIRRIHSHEQMDETDGQELDLPIRRKQISHQYYQSHYEICCTTLVVNMNYWLHL